MLLAGQMFTVANSQLVVQQGRNQIEVFIAIEPIADSVKPDDLKVSLSDISTLSGHILSLAEPAKYVGGSGKKGYWKSIWNIPGPGLGFSETHLILVKLDSFSGIVTITIQPSSDPQVTLTGLTEMRLRFSREGQLRITTSAPLSGVRANWSSLISSDSGQQIPRAMLQVSNQPGGASGAEVNRQTEVVYLSIDPKFMTPGKFQGTVGLTSFQKPELGNFTLTVYSTSLRDRLIGLTLLAVGVAIYFVIAIWAKGRTKKLAAMLPAARLRDQATQLVALLTNAKTVSGYTFPTLLGPVGDPGSLLDVLNRLSVQSLKNSGYIPTSIGNPFTAQDLPGPYQTFLTAISNQMSVFALVVQWRVAQVIAMWPQIQKASAQAAGETALRALENLAIQPFPPGALQIQIQADLPPIFSPGIMRLSPVFVRPSGRCW